MFLVLTKAQISRGYLTTLYSRLEKYLVSDFHWDLWEWSLSTMNLVFLPSLLFSVQYLPDWILGRKAIQNESYISLQLFSIWLSLSSGTGKDFSLLMHISMIFDVFANVCMLTWWLCCSHSNFFTLKGSNKCLCWSA